MDKTNEKLELFLTRELIEDISVRRLFTNNKTANMGLCFFVSDDLEAVSNINFELGNVSYYYADNKNILIVKNHQTEMIEIYSREPLIVVSDNQDEEGLFEDLLLTRVSLTNLDLTQVKSMKNWFYGAKIDIVDFTGVKTPKLADMSGMFGCSDIKNIIWGGICTSYVTDMSGMFSSCHSKELILSSLLTTRVEDMSEMFDDCWAKKIDCSSFDTRNVKNMDCMFHDARVEELDLSGFNTLKVMNMDLMFSGCDVKLLNIKNFSMENVETHQYMFGGCEAKLIAKDKKVIDIYKQDTELEVSDFDYRDLPDILNARLENLDVDMSIIETIKACTNCQLIKHLWALSVSELCYEAGLIKEDVEKVLDEMEKIANISEISLKRLNEHIGRCRKKLN